MYSVYNIIHLIYIHYCRRWLKPPRTKTSSSKSYLGLIDARAGVKQNTRNMGDVHPNRHHCFSLVKCAREFGAKHFSQIATISVDDKVKLN